MTGADPFITSTIRNAYDCILKHRFDDPDLKSPLNLVLEPLATVIQNADQTAEEIKTKLKILEVRFNRCYSEAENWVTKFDICTAFFDNLRLQGGLSFAKHLSEENARLFRQLSMESFTEKGSTEATQALEELSRQSGMLFGSVTECLDAEVVANFEIMELILVRSSPVLKGLALTRL